MEMKQSKIAQYLAGNLDMENTRNKNSLYIELAEKLSYGNREDISAALAVTDKIREHTGKEPEYDPYVPGLPKRSLGQDIRAGYITPSEDAIKMHKDLTGQELPGVGNPSPHEIACTDAEVGAKAAGFQTGHPLSSMDKMALEEQRSSGIASPIKNFDQEGQDMTFGPSKVIKGSLTNNMEEVVEGLKETNSIGAGKDLENSLNALSSPGGMAKFLIDTLERAATATPSDIAKGATDLYKGISEYSQDKIKESRKPGGIASQLVEQLQVLTAQPTKALGNIADFYEKGLASQAERMMKSISGNDANKKEPGGITEHFIEQFNQLTDLSPGALTAKNGLNKLSETFEKQPPNKEDLSQEKAKEGSWGAYLGDIRKLFAYPEHAAKDIFQDFTGLKTEDTNVIGAPVENKPELDQNAPEKVGSLIGDVFKEYGEMTREKYLEPESVRTNLEKNPMDDILETWSRESFPMAPKNQEEKIAPENWLSEDKNNISKEELKEFFIFKMDQSKDLANSLGDNLTAIMEKSLPSEVSGRVYDAIMDDEKIDHALSGDYSKEWEKVEKLFDSGANIKDINSQIGESASSLPMTVIEQTAGFIEKALGKEQGLDGAQGPKDQTSGFGIETPGGKGGDQESPKGPDNEGGPLGSAFPSKEGGGGLEAIAGSIARGITYSVARKRGLGPKESGDMAEMAGKEAEDVTRIAADSKDNVGAALDNVKTAKNVAAKGMKAATELIPNPAIGKAVAIGIAIADKASDFVIDLVNNKGNATDKLMASASSLSQPQQNSNEVGGLAAAGLSSSQSGNPTSNDFMTMDAFRESIQKDRKGLTKKLVPKEDFLASGAQTAINSIGSWGSNEIKKANESPKVDEMHKMVDTPA